MGIRSLGNVIRETNALGQVINRKYDQNRNLIYEQGPRSDIHKEFTYDYANRLIKEEDVHLDGTRLAVTFNTITSIKRSLARISMGMKHNTFTTILVGLLKPYILQYRMKMAIIYPRLCYLSMMPREI